MCSSSAPIICCLKTAETDRYFRVRRVVSGLTLRLIPAPWCEQRPEHQLANGSSHLSFPVRLALPSHGTMCRTPTSAAPQRFSQFAEASVASFCVRQLVNNYNCTRAGNCDPLLELNILELLSTYTRCTAENIDI